MHYRELTLVGVNGSTPQHNKRALELIASGAVPVADLIKLPKSLASYPNTRGYYGDLRHNVKAVYQLYLGAYDGNPANLNPLPPVEAAGRYVEMMGGADNVIAGARRAYSEGEYRWVAQVLNHVVFDDPANAEARRLFDAHAWQTVVKVFDRIREQDAAYPDPEGLLPAARETLAAQERERRLAALYAQAMRDMDARRLDEANTGFEEAARFSPG